MPKVNNMGLGIEYHPDEIQQGIMWYGDGDEYRQEQVLSKKSEEKAE